MDFKSENSDTQPEDVFSKCDLCNVLLHTYEWTICNFSMIKFLSKPVISPVFSVGPCQNFDLKFLLTHAGQESIKIEVLLSKDMKLTEEMKSKEANCNLTSKFIKHTLGLEFTDTSGKIIEHHKFLPYEFKYINTSVVYAWTEKEDVSHFIHKDSLTVRAKLSMRFYSPAAEEDKSSTKKSTTFLMKDMKNLFNERHHFPDILIKVGDQCVPCHKSIIYSQYPHFAQIAKYDTDAISSKQCISSLQLPHHVSGNIGNDCEVLHISNESVDVFLSVLHFIYTKRMQVSETEDDFAVYEFARKYGVRDLSMLLMPTEIRVNSKITVKELNYVWYVKKFSFLNRGHLSPTKSPEFKTEIGNKVVIWSLILYCLDSNNIILNLKRLNGLDTDIHTLFKLRICKADGSFRDEKEIKHSFKSGTLKKFLITPDMLYNDTLSVFCDLTVSNGELSSDIKYCYPSEYSVVDLTYWINNFKMLLETEKFSDATLIVEGKELRVHRAILAARSPVFARMFESDMVEKHSGCVRIEDASVTVMKKALYYFYTDKVDDLTLTHALELYNVADKYEVIDLKSKCSEFMLQNLDAENACEILIAADLHCDEKLKAAAKITICRNASEALLSPRGIDLLSNHFLLAHDILETLSAAFLSAGCN